MVRAKIVDGDLEIVGCGYIRSGLRSCTVILYDDLELAIVEFDLRH